MKIIAGCLPGSHRIGILYDPLYNAANVRQVEQSAAKFGLKIVPLRVSSKKEIFPALSNNWDIIDLLFFVPDRTVISESLVQHIIKQALLRGVPVIGYNRFFYECGATLVFALDYREIGKDTARLAFKALKGKKCVKATPVFQAWLNVRTARLLGIKYELKLCPEVIVGP